jgi:hypothetical protein
LKEMYAITVADKNKIKNKTAFVQVWCNPVHPAQLS